MAAVDQARAQDQETELPGITVEGGTQKKQQTVSPAPAAPPPQAEPQPTVTAEPTPATEVPYDTPAAVSVVGEGEIETFGQNGLDNVIRTVPGTFTRESATNPGVAVNIRGFEGQGRVNMTIDGARQNFRFTSHEAGGFMYVDPALLAGIDIQRGAVSTAGGAGALAGTANFRTLDVSDIIKPGQDTGVLTSVTWGSNNQGFSEMGAVAARTQYISVAGAISRSEPDDYENGDGETVPFTGEDVTSGLFKVEVTPDSENKLKIGGVLYKNQFAANGYDQDVDSKTWTANYSYNPHDNDWIDFRLNGYHTDIHVAWGDEWLSGGPGSSSGRNFVNDGWGFDASNTSRFNLGLVLVSTTYGYEYFQDDAESYNTLDPSAAGGVNPSGRSTIRSFFSETTFTMGMFDLIAGLRRDSYELEGTYSPFTPNPLNLPAGQTNLDQDDSRWNPKITLAANPTDWLQPYITYSESMRAPTINETLLGGSHPGAALSYTPFFPNPYLDPEVQKGWEIGANIKQDGVLVRGDTLRLKADYYRMNVENYITACETTVAMFFGPPPAVDVPAYYFCNQPGTSMVQGIETQGSYDAGYAFGSFSFTWTDTNLPTQANGLTAYSYIPDRVLTLTGGMRFLQQKLTVGGRAYFVSDGFTGTATLPAGSGFDNGPDTDSYELFDLFSSYKFDNGLELGLTVTNVFDRAYTPATETPIVSFAPIFDGELGQGRTFLLTARGQF